MKYSILIVDDSQTMRKILFKSLRLCDLPIQEIWEASNGSEGLQRFQKSPQINLILLNIHMPIMGGEEMFWRICQYPVSSRPLVVFVSSESSSLRIERLLKKGAFFVHKPFTPEELQSALFYALNQREEKNEELPPNSSE